MQEMGLLMLQVLVMSGNGSSCPDKIIVACIAAQWLDRSEIVLQRVVIWQIASGHRDIDVLMFTQAHACVSSVVLV